MYQPTAAFYSVPLRNIPYHCILSTLALLAVACVRVSVFHLSSLIIQAKKNGTAVFFARPRQISVFASDKRIREGMFFVRGSGEAWRFYGLHFRKGGDIFSYQHQTERQVSTPLKTVER